LLNLLNKNINFYSFIFFMLYFFIQPLLQYEFFLKNINDYLEFSLLLTFSVYVIIQIKYFFNLKKLYFTTFDILVLVFFLNMLIQILIDYTMYSSVHILFKRNIVILLYAIMFYYFGKSFFDIKKYFKYFLIAYFILTLEKLLNLDFSSFHIIIQHTINIGNIQTSNTTSLYLYLGDTFAILSLLILTFLESKYVKIFFIFVSLLVLYTIYSRTSLYLYFIVAFIYIKKEFNLKTKLIVFTIFILFMITIINYFDFNKLENTRMLSFLFSGHDASLNGRLEQINSGLNGLFNNFIIGDYGGQYFNSHSFGSYMHNILSYIRQFGIISIVLFLFLFYKIIKLYILFTKNYFDSNVEYIFYISLFIFLEVFLARSYISPLLWFAFGMLSNTNNLSNHLIKKGNYI